MTRMTTKYQATVPKHIRDALGLKAGQELEWHTLKTMVVVNAKPVIKDPVGVLTSGPRIRGDALKLVKEAREELFGSW
ncbi:AbrB/MazE/SpoVT family DNA-binding domain-containing protein [Candidatus Woesearchaeota archaeon]|nr:AbrB/MazE/SpoVT family DNA-binding domain-containing protein [Candidatus Woesearchaeota archaeon]